MADVVVRAPAHRAPAHRARLAVDDLSVRGQPGRVTGFLGPNGSGTTTTTRCVLGLTPRPPERRRCRDA